MNVKGPKEFQYLNPLLHEGVSGVSPAVRSHCIHWGRRIGPSSRVELESG